MRLLSALFDAALLPLDIAADVVMAIPKACDPFDHSKSNTRKRIEKIEDEVTR